MTLTKSMLCVAGALTVALAGCGATSEPVSQATAPSGAAVTVADAAGNDVVLPGGTAQRVVALEWEYAEILTTLGAGDRVIGMSDLDGYESFVAPTVPLDGDPADVGERTEPSIESIADLEPDVIVASARSIPESVRAQLEDIAPVLVLDMDNPSDPLQGVKDVTTTLGTLVGEEDAAAEWNTKLDEDLADNAERIADAGAAGRPAVFAYVAAEGSTVSVRMHVPGSAADAVLEQMGLQPAWTDPSASDGLTYLDVEGLTQLPPDTEFFYWDESTDPIDTNLAGNGVWASLPFVAAGNVDGVAEGVWMYGGPQSLIEFSNQTTDVLTGA